MHTHESLGDIRDDLERAIEQFMRGDYQSHTDAMAKVATSEFINRFARYAEEYSYIKARRLVGLL